MKRSKILAIALAALLVAVGSLWAGGKEEQKPTTESQTQTATTMTASPVVLRLAETHPAEYPTTKGDFEFARLVKERSNGRIQIEVYPSSQLGEEKAVIEQVQFGAIDMTRVSISPLAAFVPEFDALQMPYLYRNADHMWKVLRGPIGKEFLANLGSSGFVGLCWYESGARSFYNSKREVKTPADLRGMKIRVQQAPLMVDMVKALGAVPTPMDFGEVYSALQTGVVDGAENNWPSYFSTSHYEVAKYYTLDDHTRVPEITVASKISMDKLSQADQDLIKQAAWDSMDYQIAQWAAYEKVAQEKIRANGNVITLVPDNSAWQAAMKPMYDKLTPALQKVVADIRAVQ